MCLRAQVLLLVRCVHASTSNTYIYLCSYIVRIVADHEDECTGAVPQWLWFAVVFISHFRFRFGVRFKSGGAYSSTRQFIKYPDIYKFVWRLGGLACSLYPDTL